MELDRILCIKAKRVLRNDFTIAYNGKLYQIEDNIRARDVIVEERIDDSTTSCPMPCRHDVGHGMA